MIVASSPATYNCAELLEAQPAHGVADMNDEDSDWISLDEAASYVEAAKGCYQQKAIDLLRQAADGLKLKTRTSPSRRWIVSVVAGETRYHADDGKRIEFYRKDVLAFCESKSTPPKIRSGAISDGIRLAIKDLWPDGIPDGVRAKDRDNQILDWLKHNNKSIPTNISRAVQRALKAARDA